MPLKSLLKTLSGSWRCPRCSLHMPKPCTDSFRPQRNNYVRLSCVNVCRPVLDAVELSTLSSFSLCLLNLLPCLLVKGEHVNDEEHYCHDAQQLEDVLPSMKVIKQHGWLTAKLVATEKVTSFMLANKMSGAKNRSISRSQIRVPATSTTRMVISVRWKPSDGYSTS